MWHRHVCLRALRLPMSRHQSRTQTYVLAWRVRKEAGAFGLRSGSADEVFATPSMTPLSASQPGSPHKHVAAGEARFLSCKPADPDSLLQQTRGSPLRRV